MTFSNRCPKATRIVSLAAFTAALGLIGLTPMVAQQNQVGDPEVLGVVPKFYMIAGAGGNIGVQIGPDGVVVVNAGAADMSAKVLSAISKVTTQPIRYIIDTNADPDNVGGNERLAKAGKPFRQSNNTGLTGLATVLATEKVLDRMSAAVGKQPAYSVDAWPAETFVEKEKHMYLNREGIEVLHELAAHTDGDAMVYFRRSDVLMAGDILDTTRFPVIDIEKGGSIQGEIDALNRIIEIAIPSIPLVWQEGGTIVIPGRGRLCDQADVVEYRDMVTIIRDVIQDMITRGMTLDQVKKANPTNGYRKRYGVDSGLWTTDMFVEAVYKSLTAKRHSGA